MSTDLVNQRLCNQRLTGPPVDTPEEMIRWFGAVQAQDYAGAKWGVAQRCRNVTDTDLDRLFNDGAILRTHVLRPTWHFVLPEDIRWLLALTGPRVVSGNASRSRQLGLDDATYARSNAVIAQALEGGRHLSRDELTDTLNSHGIDATGQRRPYLLMRAELDGIICSGPRRGKQFTYALLDERVPPSAGKDRDDALVELTRRYFRSHGPATAHDFAWWSGLTVTDARKGIVSSGDALTSDEIDGQTSWRTSPEPQANRQTPQVRLLPNFDEYLVAYRNRDAAIDAAIPDHEANPLANTVVRDGLVVGHWTRKLLRNEVVVTPDVHVDFGDEEQAALVAAAGDYGRFLGMPAKLA